MADNEKLHEKFTANHIDLLSEKVGGKALHCSDEWFAGIANLTKPGRGVFIEGKFVNTGQWMDGWESRRSFNRRSRGESGVDHDWAILRLGIPGTIQGLDIDTNNFKGNAPEYASVEACFVAGDLNDNAEWLEILPKSSVQPHRQHLFEVNNDRPFTHVRLNIYPDGGVARFRVYGDAFVNPENFVEGELVDLASVVNGGRGLLCSDMFFSSPTNLLMPRPGINMGDGWETRRRRDDKNDWNIIKLGLTGSIRKVIVDTAHFKGNYPDRFSLEATYTDRDDIQADDIEWQTVIPVTHLYADQEHLFIKQILVSPDAEFTHVRLNIFPDGGVSRLRVFGFPRW